MKTRNSLVSNSSTSSSITILKIEDFNNILHIVELHPFTLKVISEQMISSNVLNGDHLIVFQYISGNDTNIGINSLPETDEYDSTVFFEQIHDVKDKLCELNAQQKAITISDYY